MKKTRTTAGRRPGRPCTDEEAKEAGRKFFAGICSHDGCTRPRLRFEYRCNLHAQPRCTCPTVCDCEDEPRGLCSNECPEHNIYPQPNPTCQLHNPEPR